MNLAREEAARQGADFLVLVVTSPPQVHPDQAAREHFKELLGVDHLLYPDRRIQAAGERDGYRVLALVKPFQEHADGAGEYLHGFPNQTVGKGHWNAGGHRLAASLLSAELFEILRRR